MTEAATEPLLRAHAESLWEPLSALLPGLTIEVLPSVDSTNSRLMQQARDGHTDPIVLVAQTQTAGRGRLGKAWHSDQHRALTFSLGLPLAPDDWSGLSLVVGLSVAQALHPEIRLKWPNDLWWQQRKLGGILVETAAMPERRERFVVIGIGLNLQTPAPLTAAADGGAPMPPQAPAGLCEALPDHADVLQPGWVLSQIVPPLVRDVLRFEREGFAGFAEAFAQRDALKGLMLNLSDGQVGRAQGVDAQGGLQVQTEQGMIRVTSSTVSVRPC
jgi:BirA family transcriptional regulator, biotin operon repressor / biotin---[acetyl-CoA-carboxylase] ligase